MTDYEVLGLSSSATLEEIKKMFRQLVKMNHPDKYDRDADQDLWNLANERMTQITEAYRRLSDKFAAEDDRVRLEHEAVESARRDEETRQSAEAERKRNYWEERLRQEAEDRQREEAERECQEELDERMKDSDIVAAKEYKTKLEQELFVKRLAGLVLFVDIALGLILPLMAACSYGVGVGVMCLLVIFGIALALYPAVKGVPVEELKSRLDFAKTFPTNLEFGRYLRKKNFG